MEHLFIDPSNSTSSLPEDHERLHRSPSSDKDILIEEPPLWLEELLDEPEADQMMSVTRKGHHRSSSDSFAYLENKHANATDTNSAKEKLAQRSRVRKVHYIAELERSVLALQAKGSEVSAALNFLDQQNLILGMENRALKQRLDSLSQEKFMKFLEQDMLERELARLQVLYQIELQQQQQQQQKQNQKKKNHGRRGQFKTGDLDPQFPTLSFQNKEARS